LRENFIDIPIIALTATATEKVLGDIIKNLSLKNEKVFQGSFNRKNLFYEVRPKKDSFGQLVDFLQKQKDKSGIIYCQSRKKVDQITEELKYLKFSVAPYHAGLDDHSRKINQEKFIRDEIKIVVATIAFGMGIDKPDVRFVLHMDLPKNLESYYQETGRAGRDSLPSHCLLFFSYADKSKIEYFFDEISDPAERQKMQKKLDQMIEFCTGDDCRRKYLLNYFGEKFAGSEKKETCCDICANPPEMFDCTELAQKIFSTIVRTNQRFGLSVITNVLLGSKAQKILNFKLNELPVYGIVNDVKKDDLKNIIRYLIQKNYIKQTDDQFPVLKLFPSAIPVLKNNEKIFAPLTKKPQKETFVIDEEVNYDKDLFSILRGKRQDLAIEKNLPPYTIFPDKTLQEMSYYFPQDMSSLDSIFGVGEQKKAQYGEIFLKEIVYFCKKNNLQSKDKPLSFRQEHRSARRSRSLIGGRTMDIFELWQKEKDISKIAKNFLIKETTVLDHIFKLVLAKKITDISYFVTSEKLEKIKEVHKKNPNALLSELKSVLGEDFSYDEIKIGRAFLRNN